MNKKKNQIDEAKAKSSVDCRVSKPPKLEPCPFCGNRKVKVIQYEALGFWRCVQCNKCKGQFYFFNKGVNVGIGHGTLEARKERIIERWNKRVKA